VAVQPHQLFGIDLANKDLIGYLSNSSSGAAPMPATGFWGLVSLLVLIVLAALAIGNLPNILRGSWFSGSSVISLICTGGEITTREENARSWTDRSPDLSITLHLDTHLVQVHVGDNEPLEAPIRETQDDIHFNSSTLRGDINRLTGKARIEVVDGDRRWNFDALECAKRSQRF
jgi:hypothetical protein